MGSEKRFFHELKDAEFEDAARDRLKYSQFRQPEWCGYPNALDFYFGCWSLTGRLVKNEDYCRNCGAYKRIWKIGFIVI